MMYFTLAEIDQVKDELFNVFWDEDKQKYFNYDEASFISHNDTDYVNLGLVGKPYFSAEVYRENSCVDTLTRVPTNDYKTSKDSKSWDLKAIRNNPEDISPELEAFILLWRMLYVQQTD